MHYSFVTYSFMCLLLHQFDRLLLSSWEKAMRDGVFRYDLTEVATRIVPGRYGIVAMVGVM